MNTNIRNKRYLIDIAIGLNRVFNIRIELSC